jgi:hypothetical protein
MWLIFAPFRADPSPLPETEKPESEEDDPRETILDRATELINEAREKGSRTLEHEAERVDHWSLSVH